MNIKKLAASLMMLSLCTVGVGNVSAANPPITTPPERLINDLVDGSPEYNLYVELRDRIQLDLMRDMTYSPRQIRSLKKYIGLLMREDANLPDIVARANTTRDKQAVLDYLANLSSKVAAKYHNDATTKAGETRNMIMLSTACLDAICAAIRIVNGGLSIGDIGDLRTQFDNAMGRVGELYYMDLTGGGRSLEEQLRLYWSTKDKTRGTAQAVDQHVYKIGELIDALSLLVATSIVHALTSLDIFHFMYQSMCERGAGQFVLDYCKEQDPEFERKYDEWLAEHHEVKPVNKSLGADVPRRV